MLSIFLMCLSTISHAIAMVHLFNGSVLIPMTRGRTNYFCFEGCSLTTFLYFSEKAQKVLLRISPVNVSVVYVCVYEP